MPNSRSVTDIVSESLGKVVEQFNAAMKDTRDYVKKAFEEIIDAPTASGMDTTSESVRRTIPVTACSSDAVEVVDEYIEREKRKNNLIFHNLPEPSGDSTELRSKQDTTSITELVEAEFGLPNIKIRRIACLGIFRSGSSRPRLLLVKLEDVSTKRIILKQATKLRQSSTWSNIYISPDLTPKERSQNKLLRDELKSRRSAEEKDIYIKRGRIVSRPAGAGTPADPSN